MYAWRASWAAARVFGFDQIQDAHRLLESGEANGKIVVTV
jgi:NADPH:quinone reductase-like Zn-dependent oxidoreductase